MESLGSFCFSLLSTRRMGSVWTGQGHVETRSVLAGGGWGPRR